MIACKSITHQVSTTNGPQNKEKEGNERVLSQKGARRRSFGVIPPQNLSLLGAREG